MKITLARTSPRPPLTHHRSRPLFVPHSFDFWRNTHPAGVPSSCFGQFILKQKIDPSHIWHDNSRIPYILAELWASHFGACKESWPLFEFRPIGTLENRMKNWEIAPFWPWIGFVLTFRTARRFRRRRFRRHHLTFYSTRFLPFNIKKRKLFLHDSLVVFVPYSQKRVWAGLAACPAK